MTAPLLPTFSAHHLTATIRFFIVPVDTPSL
ncbi:hypothetical protein J562_4392, partial [Acinetobacter baumannii 1440750]